MHTRNRKRMPLDLSALICVLSLYIVLKPSATGRKGLRVGSTVIADVQIAGEKTPRRVSFFSRRDKEQAHSFMKLFLPLLSFVRFKF